MKRHRYSAIAFITFINGILYAYLMSDYFAYYKKGVLGIKEFSEGIFDCPYLQPAYMFWHAMILALIFVTYMLKEEMIVEVIRSNRRKYYSHRFLSAFLFSVLFSLIYLIMPIIMYITVIKKAPQLIYISSYLVGVINMSCYLIFLYTLYAVFATKIKSSYAFVTICLASLINFWLSENFLDKYSIFRNIDPYFTIRNPTAVYLQYGWISILLSFITLVVMIFGLKCAYVEIMNKKDYTNAFKR